MTSTIVDPIAQKLADKASAIAGLSNQITVKGYKWPPRRLDSLPAAVVELPAISRTEVDTAEDHLGQNDWRLDFPVVFYFSLKEAAFTQAQAAEVIEAWIVALDADRSLGSTVQEARVVEAEDPEYPPQEGGQQEVRWPTRVEVLQFVTSS